MTTLDEKALETAIVAGNRSYNELRCRFDDAIYAAIRAYLAAAPEAPGQEAFSGYGEFTPISVGSDTAATDAGGDA